MIIALVLAFVFLCFDVNAAIEVPQKAIWSITDVDSLQFCDKCDPNTVAQATRRENYKRTIADTVAAGAKHIFVHTKTGSGPQERLADFVYAIGQYNLTAPADKRACMSLMYADYGTSHPNEFIEGDWLTAWADVGANYCVIDGKPVIATLDDRPDWACNRNKITNIFNRLNTAVLAPNKISNVHWVAAFGETSEYDSWDSVCKNKTTDTGLPIVYSYLEMANDNPLWAESASARRQSVKSNGGMYILGLPSASARNCGDFCGANDSGSYTHTDFTGFSRLLAGFRSGIDQLAYTFGPGGPAAKDEFASSATRCDANDLATPSAECAAQDQTKLAMVPGAPRSGVATEPDPPIEPGTGQCAATTVPPAAKAAGLTKLAFCDDFSVNSVAAGSTAAERTISGQKKWTTERASTFGSAPLDPPSAFTHNAAAGTMRVKVVTGEYNWFMTASQPRNGKMNGFDIVRQPKFYIEIRWKLEKGTADKRQPVIWSMDNCHLHKGNAGLSCPGTRYLEPDWYEYTYGGLYVHDWAVTPKAHTYCNYAANMPSTDGVWFTAGHLYQNNPAKILRYFNDVYKTEMTATRCPAINDIDEANLPILVGAKPGEIVEIDFVRVWTLP